VLKTTGAVGASCVYWRSGNTGGHSPRAQQRVEPLARQYQIRNDVILVITSISKTACLSLKAVSVVPMLRPDLVRLLPPIGCETGFVVMAGRFDYHTTFELSTSVQPGCHFTAYGMPNPLVSIRFGWCRVARRTTIQSETCVRNSSRPTKRALRSRQRHWRRFFFLKPVSGIFISRCSPGNLTRCTHLTLGWYKNRSVLSVRHVC